MNLDNVLIDVTPAPIFAAFQRLDDGVLGLVIVLGRVLVLGLVTAADVPAGETYAQVHPGIAHCQTFFTAVRVWFNFLNLSKVSTFCHGSNPLL